MFTDGVYEETIDNASDMAAALVAAAAPVNPPKEWFEDPKLSGPTPLTVEDDGRVYGHIATWDTDHIGLPSGTKPPRSAYDYAFFKTGVVRTDSGEDQPVGQLTLSGGHAPLRADAAAAVEHYDNTASSIADINAGEDEIGVWVSGALRPGVSETDIRALRASAPSGDWRPINGNLELVAICQVNTPGFPVARAMVASGELTALVAAGASHMYGLQQENVVMSLVASLENRVAGLEEKIFEDESLIAAARRRKDDDDDVDVEDDDDDDVEDVSDDVSDDDLFDDADFEDDDEDDSAVVDEDAIDAEEDDDSNMAEESDDDARRRRIRENLKKLGK